MRPRSVTWLTGEFGLDLAPDHVAALAARLRDPDEVAT